MIVGLSVGLGFFNEYRSEKAVEALHAQHPHDERDRRDGSSSRSTSSSSCPATSSRCASATSSPPTCACSTRRPRVRRGGADRRVLPVEKADAPASAATPRSICRRAPSWARSCTSGGRARRRRRDRRRDGVRPDRRSASASARPRRRSRRVSRSSRPARQVAGRAHASIFVINVALGRPLHRSRCCSRSRSRSGITPQLLPAIVTVSLATGSRRLAAQAGAGQAARGIEDLGNIEMLFTDKTGHADRGPRSRSTAPSTRPGGPTPECSRSAWSATRRRIDARPGRSAATRSTSRSWRRRRVGRMPARRPVASRPCPFDHERQLARRVAGRPDGRILVVTKGAPEAVLARVRRRARRRARESSTGSSPTAAAWSPSRRGRRPGSTPSAPADERDLALAGFLVFVDPPKPDAAASLARLRRARHHREGRHRRQRARWPRRSAASSGSTCAAR